MDDFELLRALGLIVPGDSRRTLDKMPISEQFKDKDGYYKRKLLDGTLAVQDVDEKGNPIKHNYIGGNTKETRDKFWKQNPIVRHAVDSVAREYKIPSSVLRKRLSHEGYVDSMIQRNNEKLGIGDYKHLNEKSPVGYGFNKFGLDDAATYINNGKVNLINENWNNELNTNEKGRQVNSANGLTSVDNIGITAATLKYFRNKAKQDFPKADRRFLDEATNEYYRRGEYGGKNYMKNK